MKAPRSGARGRVGNVGWGYGGYGSYAPCSGIKVAAGTIVALDPARRGFALYSIINNKATQIGTSSPTASLDPSAYTVIWARSATSVPTPYGGQYVVGYSVVPSANTIALVRMTKDVCIPGAPYSEVYSQRVAGPPRHGRSGVGATLPGQTGVVYATAVAMRANRLARAGTPIVPPAYVNGRGRVGYADPSGAIPLDAPVMPNCPEGQVYDVRSGGCAQAAVPSNADGSCPDGSWAFFSQCVTRAGMNALCDQQKPGTAWDGVDCVTPPSAPLTDPNWYQPEGWDQTAPGCPAGMMWDGTQCIQAGLQQQAAPAPDSTACPPGYAYDYNGNCVQASTVTSYEPGPAPPPAPTYDTVNALNARSTAAAAWCPAPALALDVGAQILATADGRLTVNGNEIANPSQYDWQSIGDTLYTQVSWTVDPEGTSWSGVVQQRLCVPPDPNYAQAQLSGPRRRGVTHGAPVGVGNYYHRSSARANVGLPYATEAHRRAIALQRPGVSGVAELELGLLGSPPRTKKRR